MPIGEAQQNRLSNATYLGDGLNLGSPKARKWSYMR